MNPLSKLKAKMRLLPHLLLCGAVFSSMAAYADSTPNFDSKLTGDWQGKRTALANRGVDITLNYTWDAMRVTKGGKKQGGRALDNTDIILNMDGEKLWNIEGSSARIYALGNSFGLPNADLVGTSQGVDNIEVVKGSGKLFEAWLQQNIWNDKVSLLAGLYNVNGEFYLNNASALFLHPTFGMGTELLLTGLNGPSVFPTTAVGARVKIQPTPTFYAMAAATDGVAGDPKKLRGTHVHLRHKDGAFLIAESGYTPKKDAEAAATGKYAVGAWQYTAPLPDLLNPTKKRHLSGAYAMVEQQLYSKDGMPENLTGFVRMGVTKGDVSQLKSTWSAGLNYQGFSSKRPNAVVGVGVHQAQNTKAFYQAAWASGTQATRSERGVELTYQDQIIPGITIQPDVQYIVRPGMNKQQKNAVVVGVRLKLTL
jgi:porin